MILEPFGPLTPAELIYNGTEAEGEGSRRGTRWRGGGQPNTTRLRFLTPAKGRVTPPPRSPPNRGPVGGAIS